MSLQIPLSIAPTTAFSQRARVDEVSASGGNWAMLAQHLGVLAEAEGGVIRLRQLVLGLALKGGLSSNLNAVERRPNDENLPPDWQLRAVGEIADCVLGKMLDKSKHRSGTQRPYLRNINVRWGTVDLTDLLEMYFEEDELERYGVQRGDVLICEGGEPGRAAVWNGPDGMLIQKAIHRVRPHKSTVLPEWIVMSLRHDTWAGRLDQLFTGATIKHFTGQVLRAYTIPVPPLAEQKRIVARVDQLMALINDLEAKQTKKRDLSTRFTKASLEALTTADAPEAFDAAWHRVVGNWECVLDRSEKVDKLRGAIRNLALRGVLTTRGLGEAPGDVVLERVEAERQRRIRSKEARRAEPLPDLEPAETPFPIPPSWAWSRLGNLCWKVADGPHFSPKYVTREEGVPFLSGRNIKIDGFELDSIKYVSHDDHRAFCERTKPEIGDVLYTKGGTTGIALVNTLDFEFSVWVHVAVLKLDQRSIDPGYVALALNSPHCYAQSQKYTHGIGNRDLGLTRMVLISIPVPPLSEQQRIVAKVDRLMKLCDDLEAKLRRAEDRASRLVEAVVQKLVT